MLSTIIASWGHPVLFTISSPEWFFATLLLMPWTTYPAWKSKYLSPWLIQHCTHTIISGKSYTMLTSIFSYGSTSYLVFMLLAAPIANICASSWFMHSLQLQSTYESTPTFHMTAFFLSAGMFSLFSSRILNYVRFRTLNHLEKSFKNVSLVPPLRSSSNPFRRVSGASGVIYASITLAACEWGDKIYTDTRLGSTSITMSDLWKIWCAVEGIFMVMGVGPINWAAHICGAAYGALYQQYGPAMWLWFRRTLGHYS
ncbi:hypothetical protein BDQ12DRAFT_496561 [Crucibulum laeve]|uniref:Peptidase S54 rhomboid domain-containing protein n=1 Tax=Crucibulum laeve TaxID=68775 RepID=A0A5C3M518_9AGAR|nr:hypothetical protein BDQ12DRAFT_496561 [Crucibulum laeve]